MRIRNNFARPVGWFVASVRMIPLVLTLASGLFGGELDEILRGAFETQQYRTRQIGQVEWLENGRFYTVREEREIARYETASSKREVLVPASQITPHGTDKPLSIDHYAFTSTLDRVLIFTNTRKVWRQNTRGDYWLLDRTSGALRKIGGDAKEASLMFAKFSPDGRKIAYVRENNLYVEDVVSGSIRALTKDGSVTIINGTSDWVYEEELGIRDGFRWSPDSRQIAFWRFDSSAVGNFPLVNQTTETYPTIQWIRYAKTGTTNSQVRIGVVQIANGRTRWMKTPGDPSASYLARLQWTAAGLFIQQLNRAQNQLDVLLADPRSGEVERILREQDDAWVDVQDDPTWFDNQQRFTWLSERDGWLRLYAVGRDGKQTRPVSPTGSDVIDLVAVAGSHAYYSASPASASERYLFRAALNGSGAQRLTPADQPGTHTYNVSPDGAFAIHTYSRFDQIPVQDLVRLPGHERVRMLEENQAARKAVEPLLRQPTEFLQVSIGGGITLDGWMMKPREFHPDKKYPVLLHIYGEPASTTVVDRWDGRNGLFHRALNTAGYIVISFDNRGTATPKGRAWRKAIHGAIGVLSAQELAAAVQKLVAERSYLDRTRLAVWGWSGGGSNTLNLLFRSPDLFQAGMSVAPVPDQRLYDTIYQERYMGTPEGNPKGFSTGSPIHFAAQLQAKLLLVHGTGDDNVHYQGTELLINRLVELGKPFDMMAYPNRSHSINEGKGTSLHLYQLLARYLTQHVPPGAH